MVVLFKMKSNYNPYLIALAEKAASELQGTCKAIYELGEEFEAAANEQVFCNRLDELVFECQECNWWFEQSEVANRKDKDWICEDCSDEEDLEKD